MGQALAIARGDVPAQLRFQAPYLHPLDIQPTGGYSRVDRLEIVTLFRRLELIGVEHARINDSFGRGGYRDVREALQPWLGKVSIAIHVQILPTMQFNPQLPGIDVRLGETKPRQPIAVRRTPIYNSGGVLSEGFIESDFDGAAVDKRKDKAIVLIDGKRVGAVAIDFNALR
jgi:hypothetical protein